MCTVHQHSMARSHQPSMARSHPHPLALFSLAAKNVRAKDVIAHPCNKHLVSTMKDGKLALDIGPHIRSKSCNTLATLGRNDTDITVNGSCIARVQCSFEIDPDTRVVMLFDRSNGQSTQVFGNKVIPFEHGRPRRVLVQQAINTTVGMGGVGRDFFQFELIWHQSPTETMAKVKKQEGMLCVQEEDPRVARTCDAYDEAPTILPSQRMTRIQTPEPSSLKIRSVVIEPPLGSGQFGVVYKSIDADSGKLMAVKKLLQPTQISEQGGWQVSLYYALKREVETLSRIRHVGRPIQPFISMD